MKKAARLLTLLTILTLFLTISGSYAAAEDAGTKPITDMAGRTVMIPNSINAIVSTGQPGAVLLYTLCPDKLLAWNSALADASLPYLTAELAALPVIGSMQGGKTSVNPEEVLALGPDLIVYMTTLTKNTAAKADEIQTQMGIPVVTVSFAMKNLGDSYRFLGDILGLSDKAETLAAFCDALIADVLEKAQTIAPEDMVTFYYASGGAGLQTSPAGVTHTEIFEMVGGVNVVDLPAEQNGRLKVDMERLLAWNPDVIIASTPGLLKSVKQFAHVDAVLRSAAYSAPIAPFPWLDAPVSVNRLIGLCWAAETLYPAVYGYDLSAMAQEVYRLFYGYTLTDAQLSKLLP